VDLQVPAEGLAIYVDPDRLAQVVANLLTNAAKYSEMGTVVHVEAEGVGKRVRVRVRDEGIGIEPVLLSKVFDLFFQPPQSLDRAKGGLGLGLAIVRSLVQLHGGAVFAMSDGPGKGSEFVIELPLDATVDAIDGYGAPLGFAAAAPEPTGRVGKRILVVDDNVDAAESMADLLALLGNEIAIAHDGPEALRIAPTFNPDICVVDIGLPAMDGYELARRLRDSCLAEGARLIAVTGYGQATDRQRSREAGFDAHLVKPVNPDVLERTVAN
jgi:two-component system CheB/CheR fusion protein